MKNPSENHLIKQLNKRRKEMMCRSLVNNNNSLIDFCSNDYLGFAQSIDLGELINKNLKQQSIINVNGSTGSRLISGNYQLTEDVEKTIAKFHNSESGLIFNSGYDANVGLFSCIAHKGDTIIYDELIHASVRDGIRISFAHNFSFEHNNMKSLEAKLKIAKGNIYIAVESVYSMDGDFAPLNEISELADKYNALLIVDEAHATGVFGELGRGLVSDNKLEKNTFARVITFGKALGCHGAIVLGSENLRNYLINFARSFIYTTALPIHSIISIMSAYQLLNDSAEEIKLLHSNINYFKELIKSIEKYKIIDSNSAIQSIIIKGNANVKAAASKLQQSDFAAKAILSPTVPQNEERLRICIHSFNTKDSIKELTERIAEI